MVKLDIKIDFEGKYHNHSLKDISREEWENLEELLNDYKEGKCTGIKENSLLTFIIQ